MASPGTASDHTVRPQLLPTPSPLRCVYTARRPRRASASAVRHLEFSNRGTSRQPLRPWSQCRLRAATHGGAWHGADRKRGTPRSGGGSLDIFSTTRSCLLYRVNIIFDSGTFSRNAPLPPHQLRLLPKMKGLCTALPTLFAELGAPVWVGRRASSFPNDPGLRPSCPWPALLLWFGPGYGQVGLS